MVSMKHGLLSPLVSSSLVLAFAAGGCAPEAHDHTVVRCSDYLPVARSLVEQQALIPPPDPDRPGLLRGWEDAAAAGPDGLWVVGTTAEAQILLLQPHPVELVIDAEPFAGRQTRVQLLQTYLNGEPLGEIQMQRQRASYRITLPVEQQVAGVNHLRLQLDHALRPSGVLGSDDRRPLAVKVYSLAVLPPGQGSVPRQDRVTLEREGSAESTLVLPARSLLEILVEVPPHGRLVGRLRREAGDGELQVVLELEDTEGQVHELVRQQLAPGSEGAALDYPVSAWQGQLVRLRAVCQGPGSGAAALEGLELVTAAGTQAAEEAMPQRLTASPSTGRLGRPDIVVVLLDAARRDAFEVYGSRYQTPSIARLAAQGTTFTRAWAPTSWTGQSIPSLLTGREPLAHGVQTWGDSLPASIPTLPQLLADAGYHTSVWSHHNIYWDTPTLRRGFAVAQHVPLAEGEAPEDISALLHPDKPSFVLVHLLPPHGPYEPPPPFLGSLTGWSEQEYECSPRFLNALMRSGEQLEPDHLRFVKDRYCEHARYADDLLGRVLGLLEQEGRYDDALVVVLADHGEGFGEHGAFLHTRFLYNEVLAIPLVVKWPASLGGFCSQAAAPVSLVDVAPTLLDGVGVQSPQARFQGRSLLAQVFDDAALPSRTMAMYTRGIAPPNKPARPIAAITRGSYKLIYDLPTDRVELYDLSADSGEHHDLADAEPLRAEYLLQQLRLQLAADREILAAEQPAEGAKPLDEQSLEELRALGYAE